MSAPLPTSIDRYVRAFVARQKGFALARALGVAVLAAVASTIVVCLLDRLVALPRIVRLSLLILVLTCVSGILFPALRRLGRRVDYLRAAADIELADKGFGERLRTVVSQLLERAEYRGSSQLLGRLVTDVCQRAETGRPQHLVPWRQVLWPWSGALAGVAILASLWLIPAMGLPILLSRFVKPLANTPPVTTTRIHVDPQNVKIHVGQPLAIKATVRPLEGAAVDVFTSEDGDSWSRIPMLALSEEQFLLSIPAVERDIRYYVRGGDATTPVYQVTVLRKPAVAELRLHYDFPAYTGREPVSAADNEGVAEALVGTTLTVTLVATEPLESATLKFPAGKGDKGEPAQAIAMTATKDPRVLHARVPVRATRTASLSMVSSEGETSDIPEALSIKAQPDREPLVRMIRPSDDLRLHPRDLMPVQYQFMDDYGLATMSLVVQVNSQAQHRLPIGRKGDARRQEGQYVLDLATLKLKIGDVVTVALAAEDGAGHRVERDRRQLLIAPRSIDIDTYEYIAEMRQALRLSDTFTQEAEQSAHSLLRLEKGSGFALAERLRVTRGLSSAIEAGLLLHQSLLRACANSPSPETTQALADLVDRVRVQLATAERLGALDAVGEQEKAVAERLRAVVELARLISADLKVLVDGEQSAAVLAERANLNAMPMDKASERLKETVRRAQQDLREAIAELGLQETANLDDRLKRRIESARNLARSRALVDFERAARLWTESLRTAAHDPPPLAERLSSASSVEALRPDGQPIRARDLQLASRAAARLAAAAPREADTLPDALRHALDEFPEAILVLQHEHEMNRHPADVRPPVEADATRRAAADARLKLIRWADQADLAGSPGDFAAVEPEDLAMQASVETYLRRYASAQDLDLRLARAARERGTDGERPGEAAVARAAAIDDADAEQRQISERTAQGASMDDAQTLEELQRSLSRRLEPLSPDKRAGDPGAPSTSNSRQLAAAAIQRAQEELAALPQRLSEALAAAEMHREASLAAEQARNELAASPPPRRPMAQRAADEAKAAMKDAAGRLHQASAPLAVERIDKSARDLKSFEPETTEAIQAMTEHLQPALGVLGQALKAGDKGAVGRGAQLVRISLERTQILLREAQFRVLEKDPIVAARWFADAAAAALAERPPDFKKARREQENVASALNRAWIESLREASLERLKVTPAYRTLLRMGGPAAADRATSKIQQIVPAVREWGFLPTRQNDALGGASAETDAPGFSEPLKLYFDAVNKAQDKTQDPKKK